MIRMSFGDIYEMVLGVYVSVMVKNIFLTINWATMWVHIFSMSLNHLKEM